GGVLLGVEAVLEFQVLTNAYSAEFGRSSGGVINAVTRSGVNEYHGSLFEFHRNSALDARTFFDPPSRDTPDFTRHPLAAVPTGSRPATRCSCATPTIAATWTASRPTSHRSTSNRSAPETPTSPSSSSTPSRARS